MLAPKSVTMFTFCVQYLKIRKIERSKDVFFSAIYWRQLGTEQCPQQGGLEQGKP